MKKWFFNTLAGFSLLVATSQKLEAQNTPLPASEPLTEETVKALWKETLKEQFKLAGLDTPFVVFTDSPGIGGLSVNPYPSRNGLHSVRLEIDFATRFLNFRSSAAAHEAAHPKFVRKGLSDPVQELKCDSVAAERVGPTEGIAFLQAVDELYKEKIKEIIISSADSLKTYEVRGDTLEFNLNAYSQNKELFAATEGELSFKDAINQTIKKTCEGALESQASGIITVPLSTFCDEVHAAFDAAPHIHPPLHVRIEQLQKMAARKK